MANTIKNKDGFQKKFNKFIEKLHLIAVEVLEIKFDKKESFSPPAAISINEESRYKVIDQKAGIIAFYHNLCLTAKKKGTDDSGLRIEIVYKLTYQNVIPVTEEISELFSHQSFTIHAWPYFRQFVQDLTVRALLPPLTLDLIMVKKRKPELKKK